MKAHLKRHVVFASLFALVAAADVEAQNAARAFVTFSSFIQSVNNASAADYVARSGSKIRNIGAFEPVRQHILTMYSGVQVTQSYVLDGQYFDCIAVLQQPSIRLLALSGIATPPPDPPEGDGAATPQVGVSQKADSFGNPIGCASGHIPMRRITIEELTRFESLEQFLQKGPDGAGQLPSISPVGVTHKYAYTYQNKSNQGGSNTLNLWSPPVDTAQSQVFSLAQHWIVGYYSNNVVQTVEGGWQVYPQKYATTNAVLFIYWTADGYGTTGCYNLDCPGFVQTSSSLHLGAGFSNYSVAGGPQYQVTLSRRLYQGNWWLGVGSKWVGYYPILLYQNGPLASQSTQIEFGGETVGSTSWPPMGGGSFASSGFRHAAYQKNIKFYNSSGNLKSAVLTGVQSSPSCYTAKVFNKSGTSWGTYFFFGGPGGTNC
jgi:hypothetical protein